MKKIRAVSFDFGGVLAEEGFREGLKAIGLKNGIDPDGFFSVAEHLIHDIGYVTGSADESAYWEALRKETGVTGDDGDLRKEILQRFVLRRQVLDLAGKVHSAGFVTSIISDQTNWLDELEEREHFFHHFDFIFNSYKLHKSKRDPSIFTDVCLVMGIEPPELFFVDDNSGNIENAKRMGLHAVLFTDAEALEKEIERILAPGTPLVKNAGRRFHR